LLRTTLRAGNADNSAFGFNNGITTGTALEAFFQDPVITSGSGSADNIVGINRLFYQFPIGSNFTATFGARVRQDDMLAMWPSVYPADSLLDMFTYAGSPVVYALNLGGGAGLWWRDGGFSISANYVSGNAGNGTPNASLTGSGGVGNNSSASSTTVQIGYAGNNWGIAGAYSYNQNLNYQGTAYLNSLLVNSSANGSGGTNSTNGFALSAYWQPSQSGWVPSISAGWGVATTNLLAYNGGSTNGTTFNNNATAGNGGGFTTNSWTIGLQWADAFVKGNALGMGFGQNTMVSAFKNGGGTPNDGNWAWEWWYKIQATDNISVTPGIFYLSRPLGGLTTGNSTGVSNAGAGSYFSSFGYLIKTTFKF
jgi:hypothetical protein